MSRFATIKAQIRDLAAIAAPRRRMSLAEPVQRTAELFGSGPASDASQISR